jgi:hypothetical protein
MSLVFRGAFSLIVTFSISVFASGWGAGDKEGWGSPRGSKLSGHAIRRLPLETTLDGLTAKKGAERSGTLSLMWKEPIGRCLSDMRSILLKNGNHNRGELGEGFEEPLYVVLVLLT